MLHISLMVLILLIAATLTAAADADVAGAVAGTWGTAKVQIQSVVNTVVFPVLDTILAIFFFTKIGSAYFDCAPVKAL